MTKYTLLTGATGLVGRYLTRDLLLQGNRIALVLRRSRSESVFERVEAIQQMWEDQLGRSLPRPVCFEGDVTQDDLGLDVDARRWIAEHCDCAIHNAAVLTFHGSDPEGEPWKTNVQGTRNVLDFCREMDIRKLHYVSTAYVCGTRQDLFKEDELDVGQQFRNDYERSKFQAEKLVRAADFLDSLTVYRPAVIAGDSRTGYTNTYHGLYMYLKLMSVLVRNEEPGPDGVRYTPVRLDMTGDEPRNIVPVDWVSAVICRLFNTPAAHGGTYHLSPIEPITPRQIIDAGYTYFNSRGVEFIGTTAPEDGEPLSNMDEAAHNNMSMYESYETTDPDFDTSNLLKFTADLPCPRIDEVMLHRFWRFGEQDRWGKRRQKKAEVPFWASDHLRAVVPDRPVSRANGNNGSGRQRHIGLEITGPGGGQWTITLSGDHAAALELGLPDEDDVVLHLSINTFRDLVENAGGRLAADQIRLKQPNGSAVHGELAESVIRQLLSSLSVSDRVLSPVANGRSDRLAVESQMATED